jgi:Flp pilus assembly protein TadD
MTTSTAGNSQNDGRLQQLQRMLEKSPDDPFLLYGIGMEHKKAGDAAGAIEFFKRTIAADAGYCYAYYQRGLVCESQGDEAGARLAYQEGIVAARRKGDTHAEGEIQAALDMLG